MLISIVPDTISEGRKDGVSLLRNELTRVLFENWMGNDGHGYLYAEFVDIQSLMPWHLSSSRAQRGSKQMQSPTLDLYHRVFICA